MIINKNGICMNFGVYVLYRGGVVFIIFNEFGMIFLGGILFIKVYGIWKGDIFIILIDFCLILLILLFFWFVKV